MAVTVTYATLSRDGVFEKQRTVVGDHASHDSTGFLVLTQKLPNGGERRIAINPQDVLEVVEELTPEEVAERDARRQKAVDEFERRRRTKRTKKILKVGDS